MKSTPRALAMKITAAIGIAVTLALGPAAVASPPTPPAPSSTATWHLSDYEQRACLPAGGPNWTYFVGFLSGSWDSPLVSSVEGLPEGTGITLDTTIPPGDNGDRSLGNIWLFVDLPPLAHGDYPATLSVTDGTHTQTMPILIRIQDSWGC